MSKMSKLFDQDNMFFAIMGVLFDLIILNVLTLLCCLPVVTAGASFTAMHSVLWRMVRHEETYVARQFFDSFKRNLKQSLLPWLAFLLAAIVLVVDGMLARSMGSMRGPLMACVAFMGLVIIAIAQYFFPLLSRYENPTSETLKNATKLALGFFPRTLCMLVILAAFAVLYAQFFIYMIPLLILMGVTLPQYCCAWIYNWIFRRIDGEIDAKGAQGSAVLKLFARKGRSADCKFRGTPLRVFVALSVRFWRIGQLERTFGCVNVRFSRIGQPGCVFEYQSIGFSRIGQLQVKVGRLNDRFSRIGQP